MGLGMIIINRIYENLAGWENVFIMFFVYNCARGLLRALQGGIPACKPAEANAYRVI